MKKFLFALVGVLLAAQAFGMAWRRDPAPVTNFDLQRYLGKWYEIARFENRFESNLSHVTAEIVQDPYGKITIINRGYDTAGKNWVETESTAEFAKAPSVGELKVMFFWPFKGRYKIIALDEKDYQWAMVTARGHRYLWILSRKPTLDQKTLETLLAKARKEGYNVDKLHYTDQGMVNPPPPPPWAEPKPAPTPAAR